MNSRLLKLLIIVLSLVSVQYGQEKKESLQDLITEAIKVSPQIKMQLSKFNVAKANIEIGTNLSDPVLTLGLVNIPTNTFSFTQEPMTGKIVGLTQAIPFPGALKSASEVKAVDTSIVKEEVTDLKNKIRKEVSDLYFSLQVVRRNIELSEESINLLKQISNVVKRKYEVGNASLQNIIQVEVQITRIKDKLESLKGNESAIIAKLNGFLLRPESSNIYTEKISNIKDNSLNTDSLLKIAERKRPLLQKIRLGELKAQFMKKQAEFSFYPNFKLGFQYTQRDYSSKTNLNFTDLFSVVVGMTIPINYGGNKSEKVNRAEFLQSFYNDQYNSTLQELQKSFGSINAKIAELKKREVLISKTLLPQAIQAYKASISDYQVGKIDFVNVIKAENDILNIKTKLAKVRTDYSKNIAELEYLLGEKLKNKDLE